MGHIIFIILHLIAIAFGFLFLIITIPLHLIYSAVNKSNSRQKDRNIYQDKDKGIYAECPFCKKKIDPEANKCPYCQEWIADAEQKPRLVDDKGRHIKLCIHCGKNIRVNDYKCIWCGKPT